MRWNLRSSLEQQTSEAARTIAVKHRVRVK
jgi:hypothetical protein